MIGLRNRLEEELVPKLKSKSSKVTKSVEVKVNVPVTGVSLTSLLLIALLALIGFSG